MINWPVSPGDERMKDTALEISLTSEPLSSNVLFLWFWNCSSVWWTAFNIGPGPIALTRILGANSWAAIFVKFNKLDFANV